MGQVPLYDTPEFRALMAGLEEEWPHRRAALHVTGVPLNEDDNEEIDDGEETDDNTEPAEDTDQTFPASVVKRLREENAARRKANADLQAKLKEHEDADKTELQRAQEAAKALESRATTAELTALRLEVALDKAPENMPLAQVRKLAKRLTGTTEEEIEADAEELFADFVPDDGQEPPAGRPRVRLRPGAAPSGAEPEETNPDKLAAQVPRAFGS